MRILHRYVLWELLTKFAFFCSVLTLLLLFFGVFQQVTRNGVGPLQALQLLPYIVPSFLPYTLPATFLLAVCVVYGRISGDQEITATKAAGIHVWSLLSPAFCLAALTSFVSLLIYDQAMPWALIQIRRTINQGMEEILLNALHSQHQVEQHGISITVKGVDGKRLVHPTFQFVGANRVPVTIQSQSAEFDFDYAQRQIVLHVFQGRVQKGRDRIWVDQQSLAVPLANQHDDLANPRHLSCLGIRKEIRRISGLLNVQRERMDVETCLSLTSGDFNRLHSAQFRHVQYQTSRFQSRIRKLRTEIHSRFVLSSSSLFFAILGGPFAILRPRTHFLTTFFLCFAPILLGYYPIIALMTELSKTGTVQPAYALWLGNVLLLGVSLLVLRQVCRH